MQITLSGINNQIKPSFSGSRPRSTSRTAPSPAEIRDYFKKLEKERKSDDSQKRCDTCTMSSIPIKPYDLELMGINCDDTDKITIKVADINDEVIQSHLDAIAQRNKALIGMMTK